MSLLLRSMRNGFGQYSALLTRADAKKPKMTPAALKAAKEDNALLYNLDTPPRTAREKRRLKHINFYAPSMTKAPVLHKWVDEKRYKAAVLYHQNIRNKHRHTVKIDQKDKERIREFYYKEQYRQYQEFIQVMTVQMKYQDTVMKCLKQCESLPFHLREELTKEFLTKDKDRDEYPTSMLLENFYFEQLHRMYHDDYVARMLIKERVRKIERGELRETE